jgi:hypothetical protein
MSINRQYAGPERRGGFERRTVAPREQKGGPRLIGSVAIGNQTFGPGQESAFRDAVAAYNKNAAAANQPQVDLKVLTERGFLAGFEGTAAAVQTVRNHQMEAPAQGEFDRAASPEPRSAGWPGARSFQEVAPEPPPAGTPGRSAFEAGQQTAAAQVGASEENRTAAGTPTGTSSRRGGAGRATGKKSR